MCGVPVLSMVTPMTLEREGLKLVALLDNFLVILLKFCLEQGLCIYIYLRLCCT